MRTLAVFLMLGALCSGATGALAANAGAGTTTMVVPVQPIDVCDNSGANCASTAGLAAYETIANLIYQQAGIQFAFAPVTQYDNAQYLTDTVDTTGITVFDQAHDLVRLPGHGQSQYASALNVYFVNNLVSTTAGVVNPGTSTLGYGLVGGNGAVVATAPDANGRVAALDTLAHELGHNLGLTHVTDPLNLMDGTTRAPLVETCQITPYTCAAPPGSSTGPVQALAPAPVGARAILVGNGASPLLPGMVATGAGIPANDPVQRISGKFAVLAAPLTGAVTPGQTITFAAPP
jgi:hypothetical protein